MELNFLVWVSKGTCLGGAHYSAIASVHPSKSFVKLQALIAKEVSCSGLEEKRHDGYFW
jgi:hypothetical protein